MAPVLSLALAAWLMATQVGSLANPTTENSLPKSIEITAAYCSIRCAKPQKYEIDVAGNKDAVSRLLAAVNAPPMNEPTLGSLGITSHWLDAAKRKSYTRFDGRASDKRQKAFFSRLLADKRKADVWMKVEYHHRLIRLDDYPSIVVTMRWLDGATFNLTSSEQTVYMLPWKLGLGKTQTFNPNISRAVADLLPTNALNRERLAGDNLADEYATYLMGDSEDILNRMNVEDTLGVQLFPLYKEFRIDTLALQTISSDDLDGEYALQAHARLKSVPATNEFLNMTLSMAGAHKLANAEKAVAAAQKYEHLVARVPWIRKYLGLHKDTSLEIRVVQDRSVSRRLAASLLADLREHGKTALAHKLKSSIPSMAFVYLNGPNQAYARWFVLPDLKTLLWNYKGSTPLQQQIRGFPTWDWSGHVAVGVLFSADGVVLPDTALAQTKPFSAAPDIPPHYYPLNPGDNVQEFNGRFVQRLIRLLDNANIRSCLRSLDASAITVEAHSEGAVVTSAGGCATGSSAQSAQPSGAVTSKIATSARRALAMVLANERFNQEALFQRNDRDLGNYDVHIFDKNGKIYISFLPLPDNVNSSVAGCPPTGPIAVIYIVDPQTLDIMRGNMVC